MKLIKSVAITVTVFCMALVFKAEAVSPPPDGGYSGSNTAEGTDALKDLTTGRDNSAFGVRSLFSLTTGIRNTAVGGDTLVANNGDDNTATGAGALNVNSSGKQNTANGTFALVANKTGSDNTAVGFRALRNNKTGDFNIGIGYQSGIHVTTGSNNIEIGNQGVADDSDTIRIGSTQTATFVAGIREASTLLNTMQVVIDHRGQLGVLASSERFKRAIQPMDSASEAILQLNPVRFCYKNDNTNTAQFGLIAEQVAQVDPDLVVRDNEGKPYSVRYDQVNAMLLNEFLKEHKAFVREQHKVEKLQTSVATLVATVKEQTAQIQKVSAQLELSKSVPQTVSNNR